MEKEKEFNTIDTDEPVILDQEVQEEQVAGESEHEKKVEELNVQIEQLHDKLLRAMAESENVRRRYEKMIDDAREYAIISFAKDLLGVMDNLSRALTHKPQNLDTEASNILYGVQMTKDELSNVFKKHGLEAIEPLPGEKFDYNSHHAISQIMTEEYNPDSIVGLMQTGYKMKDRLLRPATVSVAKKIEQ